jgi:drug/metabolite transporter (DMT)-like permease
MPTGRHPRLAGTAWILMSAAGFGAMAIFAKLAYAEGISLATLLFLRFVIAGLAMLALALFTAAALPRGRDALLLAAMGGVGYVGQSFCYFAALHFASAGLTALLLYLYPALVTLLLAIKRRQKLSGDRTVAVLAALIGTALTVGGSLAGSAPGIVLGVGAALIYAIYIIVGESVSRRTGPLAASTVVALSAALVYGALAAGQGFTWPQSGSGWAAATAIALLSTAFAIVGFFKGMERLGAADAATLSAFEPVVTVVLATLVLGEHIDGMQIAGGLLILATVVYLARRPAPAAGTILPS